MNQLLTRAGDEIIVSYFFEKKYKISLPSRHYWRTIKVQLPNHKVIWYTDRTNKDGLAEAGVHRHKKGNYYRGCHSACYPREKLLHPHKILPRSKIWLWKATIRWTASPMSGLMKWIRGNKIVNTYSRLRECLEAEGCRQADAFTREEQPNRCTVGHL